MEIDFEKISSYMTETLNAGDIHAVEAWEGKMDCDHCVVVVGLGNCVVDSSGMGDYLGELDLGDGLEDVYGKRCHATLELGFYAPVRGGEKKIQAAVNQVLALVSEKGQSLRMLRFSAGGSAVDTVTGRLKRMVTMETQLYLYYLEGSTETFMDINIKGEMKNASK